MGEIRRDSLANLYNNTSRDNFQIVVYWDSSNPRELSDLKKTYPYDYIFISDFLVNHSPIKIIYGVQATPTCFLIDKTGIVIIKSIGLPTKELTELRKEGLL